MSAHYIRRQQKNLSVYISSLPFSQLFCRTLSHTVRSSCVLFAWTYSSRSVLLQLLSWRPVDAAQSVRWGVEIGRCVRLRPVSALMVGVFFTDYWARRLNWVSDLIRRTAWRAVDLESVCGVSAVDLTELTLDLTQICQWWLVGACLHSAVG